MGITYVMGTRNMKLGSVQHPPLQRLKISRLMMAKEWNRQIDHLLLKAGDYVDENSQYQNQMTSSGYRSSSARCSIMKRFYL